MTKIILTLFLAVTAVFGQTKADLLTQTKPPIVSQTPILLAVVNGQYQPVLLGSNLTLTNANGVWTLVASVTLPPPTTTKIYVEKTLFVPKATGTNFIIPVPAGADLTQPIKVHRNGLRGYAATSGTNGDYVLNVETRTITMVGEVIQDDITVDYFVLENAPVGLQPLPVSR